MEGYGVIDKLSGRVIKTPQGRFKMDAIRKGELFILFKNGVGWLSAAMVIIELGLDVLQVRSGQPAIIKVAVPDGQEFHWMEKLSQHKKIRCVLPSLPV